MIKRIARSFREYGGNPKTYFRIRKVFNPEIVIMEAQQVIDRIEGPRDSSVNARRELCHLQKNPQCSSSSVGDAELKGGADDAVSNVGSIFSVSGVIIPLPLVGTSHAFVCISAKLFSLDLSGPGIASQKKKCGVCRRVKTPVRHPNRINAAMRRVDRASEPVSTICKLQKTSLPAGLKLGESSCVDLAKEF